VIVIKPVTPLNTSVFKAVRLRALQDTPHAFGSTYAKESQFPDSEWLARGERMNGETGSGFLAMDGETACGIVGSFLDQNDPTQAHVISMWTAPTHRLQGIGRLLVNEVLEWARRRNARSLVLMVTRSNRTEGLFRFLREPQLISPVEFTPGLGAWLRALLLLIFAYAGFENTLAPGGEIKEPKRCKRLHRKTSPCPYTLLFFERAQFSCPDRCWQGMPSRRNLLDGVEIILSGADPVTAWIDKGVTPDNGSLRLGVAPGQ
jgi:GNAT superfamily N-acetyltransferase